MPTLKKEKIIDTIGHELKVNPPAILAHTRRRFGDARAEAQRRAILLNKARERGVFIRHRPSGSGPFTDREIARGYRKV